MLDVNYIKENIEEVRKKVALKNFDPKLVDKTLQLHDKWTSALQFYEKLRQERNKIAKESRGPSKEGEEIKEKLVKAEAEVNKAHEIYFESLNQIPNLPADSVPVGKGDKDNVEI